MEKDQFELQMDAARSVGQIVVKYITATVLVFGGIWLLKRAVNHSTNEVTSES